MYATLLVIHSLLRWIVLVAALIAIVRAYGGWAARRPWTAVDDRVGQRVTASVAVRGVLDQLFLGLLEPLCDASSRLLDGLSRGIAGQLRSAVRARIEADFKTRR